MNYHGALPMTGPAGLIIGGIVLGQGTLVAIASGLVLIGALCVRYSFRAGKSVDE